MTVGELLERISSEELSEWMAYYNMAPFGEERADLRSGIIASTVANANRDGKKRKKPYEAGDFMPKFANPDTRVERSPEELLRKAEMINLMFGGEDKRNPTDG